jgi:hypothetical protein
MEPYKRCEVCGVSAIVWEHVPKDVNTSAKKTERKRQKDKVGAENNNVPMLDMKQAKTGLEYCDIIIYSDNVEAWKMAIHEYFRDYSISEKLISRGNQTEICSQNNNEQFVTVNFYNNTSKLMVQPGDYRESNLLRFLKAIPAIVQLKATILLVDKDIVASPGASQIEAEPSVSTTMSVSTSVITAPTVTSTVTASPVTSEVEAFAVRSTTSASLVTSEVDAFSVKSSTSASPVTSEVEASSVNPSTPASLVTFEVEACAVKSSTSASPVTSEVEASSVPSVNSSTTASPVTSMVKGSSVTLGDDDSSEDEFLDVNTTLLDQSGVTKQSTMVEIQTDYGEPAVTSVTATQTCALDKPETKAASVQAICDTAVTATQTCALEKPKTKAASVQATRATTVRAAQTGMTGVPDATQTELTVFNDLLCFVNHQMNTIPVDNIVNLCADFYSADEVFTAKTILFETVETNGKRLISRTGVDKTKNNMFDILRVMIELKPEETPVFYARDLANLPPLGHNSTDVLKLLEEIQNMKKDIRLLTEAQTSLTELVKQQASTLSTAATLGASSAQIPTAQRVEKTQKTVVSSPIVVEDHDENEQNPAADACLRATAATPTLRQPLATQPLATHNRFEALGSTDNTSTGNSHAHELWSERLQSSRRHYQQGPRRSGSRPTANGNDKLPVWTRVYNRTLQSKLENNSHSQKRNTDAFIGRGSYTHIQGIEKHNKTCIGVFVSRLTPKTTTQQIDRHLLKELSINVKSEKLKTKYNTYSSFLIRCDGADRSRLLDTEMWPVNVLIKPFMS